MLSCCRHKSWKQIMRLQESVRVQCRRPGFDLWVGKIPWRRKWKSIPVSLPGESHGQRSLAGYNPWGRKESDMTERLSSHMQGMINWFLPSKEYQASLEFFKAVLSPQSFLRIDNFFKTFFSSCGPFKKSLLTVLQYCVCFMLCC